MNAIEVDKINKSFSSGTFSQKVSVLHDLSFTVKKNTITGFLGENGSGKTTTYKILLGAIFADTGSCSVLGKKINTKELKNKIGFMPERPQFLEHLNAKEFLSYSLNFYKNSPYCDLERVLQKVGLQNVGNKKIQSFSKGMVQRLGIAQAIAHQPELVILDEPMSGLDPSGRFEVAQIIKNIKEDGASVFLSSHLLDDIQKLCDDVVIIKEGKCIFEGAVSKILETSNASYKITYNENNKQKVESFDNYNLAKEKMKLLLSKDVRIIEFLQENSLEKAYLDLSRERNI